MNIIGSNIEIPVSTGREDVERLAHNPNQYITPSNFILIINFPKLLTQLLSARDIIIGKYFDLITHYGFLLSSILISFSGNVLDIILNMLLCLVIKKFIIFC